MQTGKATRAVPRSAPSIRLRSTRKVPARTEDCSAIENESPSGDDLRQEQPQQPPKPARKRKAKSEVADVPREEKWRNWSQHGNKSPFPDFIHPTTEECERAHRLLEDLHGDKVRENFAEDVDVAKYAHVIDAVVVAALSQATSWANAKRAMRNMDLVYGSTFAYQSIIEGGEEKLRQTLRPGGMQNRKAAILLGLLEQVKHRYGQWDLDFLFDADDDEVMRELLRYKGIGPKCAHCVMSICLSRTTFALDIHCHRIAGFWGWRPESASKEQAQSHLDARIPNSLKFSLHYLLIVHGRECLNCRGSGNNPHECAVRRELLQAASQEDPFRGGL